MFCQSASSGGKAEAVLSIQVVLCVFSKQEATGRRNRSLRGRVYVLEGSLCVCNPSFLPICINEEMLILRSVMFGNGSLVVEYSEEFEVVITSKC